MDQFIFSGINKEAFIVETVDNEMQMGKDSEKKNLNPSFCCNAKTTANDKS